MNDRNIVATPKNTGVEDFPDDSLIRFIAEHDIALALAVCSKFGGIEEYIPKRDTIDRIIVHRYIISRLDKMENARTIARSVNLGVSQVTRIIRRHLDKEGLNGEHKQLMPALLNQIK